MRSPALGGVNTLVPSKDVHNVRLLKRESGLTSTGLSSGVLTIANSLAHLAVNPSLSDGLEDVG